MLFGHYRALMTRDEGETVWKEIGMISRFLWFERLETCQLFWHNLGMTLELPEMETTNLTPAELRLELACALYARGRISAVTGSHLADLDLISFQGALKERGIPRNYSLEDLHDDLDALKKLFPA